MRNTIIRVVEQKKVHGVTFTIVEELSDYGRIYVLYGNGERGFHSGDFERVHNYMVDIGLILES